MRISAAVFVGALVAAASVPESSASACGFFDYREARPAVQRPSVLRKAPPPKPVALSASDGIAAAEQRLEEDRWVSAGAGVVASFPDIRGASTGGSPLETRALRILALALVRAGGGLATVRGFSATTDADRGDNLEWAIAKLRSIDASRPNDPVAQADLGEALARRAKYEGEALAILTDLADRDLLGSAHAYAALARMRATRGDALAGERAAAECRTRTKAPEAVCPPASTPGAPARADARLATRS